MSYIQSLYHIVFSTHNRQATITSDYCDDLYRVMAAIINKTKSKAILINGVENHIHVLLFLSPETALSNLIRDLKSQSSIWMKKSGFFPMFEGWEREYGAFSLSITHRNAIYDYIKNQKRHHENCNLEEEFNRLVIKNGLVNYHFPSKD